MAAVADPTEAAVLTSKEAVVLRTEASKGIIRNSAWVAFKEEMTCQPVILMTAALRNNLRSAKCRTAVFPTGPTTEVPDLEMFITGLNAAIRSRQLQNSGLTALSRTGQMIEIAGLQRHSTVLTSGIVMTTAVLTITVTTIL